MPPGADPLEGRDHTLGRPDHHVRRTGRHGLAAARAPIGLVPQGPRDRPDEPLTVGADLPPRGATEGPRDVDRLMLRPHAGAGTTAGAIASRHDQSMPAG